MTTTTTTTTTRNFVSQDVLVKSYTEAIAKGQTIEDLSKSLGIQPASIKSRIKLIRTQLKEECKLNDEQVLKALPSFPRKGGSGRKGGVSDFVKGLAQTVLSESEQTEDGESV